MNEPSATAPPPEGPSWKFEPAKDLGLPLGKRLRSPRRESGLIETGSHLAWWALVRSYLAVWHRLRVEGRANLPRTLPFVIAANHASHLDALVLAAPLSWRLRDRIFPIAAGDTFFETPLLTAFAAFCMNALPLWRKSCGPHALQALRERLLGEPCGYVLFPEGTRSRDGTMAPFKPGLGMLVAGTPVPVVPCHLSGAHAALPPRARVPRPRRLRLRVGEPLSFAGVADERSGWQEVAARVEAAVRRLAGSEVGRGPEE